MTAPVPARLHQPSRQPEGDGELRDGERWEWGVKHSQGIRVETSERAAREWLQISLGRKRRHDAAAPELVRRRISDWTPVDTEATR